MESRTTEIGGRVSYRLSTSTNASVHCSTIPASTVCSSTSWVATTTTSAPTATTTRVIPSGIPTAGARTVRFVKIAFYLDPLTRDTGCLRVIPGSHILDDRFANAVQDQIRESERNWGVQGEDLLPGVALETRPGDIAVFNHNLKHAAFGGSPRRRMFTINCSQRFPENRIEDFKSYISGHARFWIDRLYGETMVATAGPERRIHLEQGLAHDGHLAELAARARAEMPEPSRG